MWRTYNLCHRCQNDRWKFHSAYFLFLLVPVIAGNQLLFSRMASKTREGKFVVFVSSLQRVTNLTLTALSYTTMQVRYVSMFYGRQWPRPIQYFASWVCGQCVRVILLLFSFQETTFKERPDGRGRGRGEKEEQNKACVRAVFRLTVDLNWIVRVTPAQTKTLSHNLDLH